MKSLPDVLAPLKDEARFITWRYEERDGKKTKVPYSPLTGGRAKSNDPNTWGTFEQAAEMIEARSDMCLSGVGVVLGDGLAGVDFDHVINDEGVFDPAIGPIINALNTYVEISPSGKGLHALFRIDTDKYSGHNGSGVFRDETWNHGADMEFYPGGRYFTLTGETYGTPRAIEERTEAFEQLYQHYWPSADTGGNLQQITPRARRISRDDTEVLKLMRSHSPAGAALFDGDMSAYDGDHSRADLALANILLYWTDGDTGQADRLFKASALMRDKWEKVHYANGDTYGDRTLAKALEAYEATRREFENRGEPLTGDTYEQAVNAKQKQGKAQAEPEELYLPPITHNQTVYLDSGRYAGDLAAIARHRHDKTGFDAIDAVNAFYPGLYVLGAASSLGKTSFALQLADQVAAAGRDVLYITLEQTPAELTAKSIARLAYRLMDDPQTVTPLEELAALSASAIRAGDMSYLTKRAETLYRETIAPHMHIVRGNFRVRSFDIVTRVKEWLAAHRDAAPPLVVIDYLQAMAPMDPRATDKRSVDDAIGDLKDLQADNDLVVLAISSLNRANYMVPVSFEALKETGNIEFTADVVWGLDLACLYDGFFDTAGHVVEKREIIKAARRDAPREIVLSCLKNRFGRSSYTAGFYYDPVHDIFAPFVPEENAEEDEIKFPYRRGTYHDKLLNAKGKYNANKAELARERTAAEREKNARAAERTEYMRQKAETARAEAARAEAEAETARLRLAAEEKAAAIQKEAEAAQASTVKRAEAAQHAARAAADKA